MREEGKWRPAVAPRGGAQPHQGPDLPILP